MDERKPRLPYARYRLPAGRHGLDPELISESQRLRLLGACAEAIAECGYARTTSADVARRAGVSPTALYRHFGDLGSCVVAAYVLATDCAYETLVEPCEGGARETAVEAAIRFALAEPELGRLLGPATPWSLEGIVEARVRLVERLAALGDIDPLLLAGALALLAQRVGRGQVERFPELATELAQLLTPSGV